MTIKLNLRVIIASVLAFLSLGVAGFAYANPSYFAAGVSTNNAATTTPAFMTPGTGTSTTPVYDSYALTVNGGVQTKTEFAGVLVNFCGSSTAAVLKVAVEYSQDNVDWYRNYVLSPNQIGTTTNPYVIGTPFTTNWTFASSSVGGSGTLATCSTAAISVPTPFRYMRIVNSITGANGSVWASIVPTKEIK